MYFSQNQSALKHNINPENNDKLMQLAHLQRMLTLMNMGHQCFKLGSNTTYQTLYFFPRTLFRNFAFSQGPVPKHIHFFANWNALVLLDPILMLCAPKQAALAMNVKTCLATEQ